MNTHSAAPVAAADVAAAYATQQRTSRAMLAAAAPILSIRAGLEAGGPVPPDALALFDAAAAAADAAIAAGEAAIDLFERTAPDVFAAGMRLAWEQGGDG